MKPKVVYPYHYDQEWVRPVPAGGARPAPSTRGLKELSDALSRQKIEVRLSELVSHNEEHRCALSRSPSSCRAVGDASAQSPAGPRAGVDWPGFRGIAAGGVDDAKALPLQWSVPDAKLVKWRVPVSGLGHSSPIVWGDQVCTASAISGTPDPQLKVGLYGDIGSVLDTTEHKWIVACFDKRTGKPRWERTATTGVPIIKRHPKSTHASSTLATDGRHIVAMFGSEGPVRVLDDRRSDLEEGLRPSRFRLLHGAGRAVGLCQLAGDSQRPRHPPGRRAEGFVRGGVRRAHRQASCGAPRAPTCRRGARRRSCR